MNMYHYAKVYLQLLFNSFSYMAAYRGDMIATLFSGLLWSCHTLLVISVVFLRTDSINGWTAGDIVAALLVASFVGNIRAIINDNVGYLEPNIRKGFFDFYLTKPVDSQFLAMLGKPHGMFILNFAGYAIPLYFFLRLHPLSISWTSVPLFLPLFVFAVIIWISFDSLLATVNFWIQHVENLMYVFSQATTFGQYPQTIYPRPLQIIFMTILPVAFLAAVPAQALLGHVSWKWVIASGAVMVASVVASRVVWLLAIKNYSSASS